MGGGIEQLMVGGSKPLFAGRSGLYMHNESIGGQAHRSQWDVRSVDTVRSLLKWCYLCSLVFLVVIVHVIVIKI